MTKLASNHHILRFLGVIGLFLVVLNNNYESHAAFISTTYRPYIVIFSALLISLGLYFKLKYSEEEPSTITYISTVITLIVALSISGFLLYASFI